MDLTMNELEEYGFYLLPIRWTREDGSEARGFLAFVDLDFWRRCGDPVR